MKSAKVVQPYSSINTDSAEVLKHFWKCNGAGGLIDGGMRDHIGGAHILGSANPMVAGDVYVLPHGIGVTGANCYFAAPIQPPKTKTILIFSVFRANTANELGAYIECYTDGSEGTWEVCQGEVSDTHCYAANSSTEGTTSLTYNPDPSPPNRIAYKSYAIGIGLILTPGVGNLARPFWIDSDGTFTEFNNDSENQLGSAGIQSFDSSCLIGGNQVVGMGEVYGLVHCHFDTAPTDYALGCQWMMAEWMRGNKNIYPGWV